MDKLDWLLPEFWNFKALSFESQLSATFVAFLLVITFYFLSKSLFSFFRAKGRVSLLNAALKETSTDNIASKRRDLISFITEKDREKSQPVRHIWKEFDETLIEVKSIDNVHLHNTFDASYFFNTHTLANGVTDNRLIAAVPGFLTAVGVIGTFVGLQIGLSEMNISSEVSVEEMKAGVSAVIGGAKVAFMTSVWGVLLSVLFNFIEKSLEQNIRKKISLIQDKIDDIFPRLSPESQLQVIAHNSIESRESLQGLAEQIGIKMQESMLTATRGISEALETTLNEIMAPAINKLVDETSEGNQKALEDLLTKFMDGFGAQGNQQKEAMESASEKVNESISGMHNSMESFIAKIEASQLASGEREKELISSISVQVSQLLEHSHIQGKKMTEMMESQVGSLTDAFNSNQVRANEREQEFTSNIEQQIKSLTEGIVSQSSVLTEFVETQMSSLNESFTKRDEQNVAISEQRDAAIAEQTQAISTTTQELVSQIETSLQIHKTSSEQVIEQGKSLQQSVESSVLASAKATDSMRESATELKSAAEKMSVFGSHVRDAGNKLSGAVTEAVESTKDLANQNLTTSARMESLRDQLIEDTARFKELADQINNMVTNAGSTFEGLKTSQSEYLTELKKNVADLSTKMTNLLSDYAMQANAQTKDHLTIWADTSTQYATTMNNAARALAGVVEDIQDKVGA
ncbi:anti-phage ZorAB system protein ZorA [Psychrosphaera sp. 1_MG-2023]|uniref:anti-phage ZorAB system protein ZorA n=1 Tax=Psychrosphaera sp. 1_MG-2023 TaxID=3062643 RepID=UPI0026E32397|nr:anti-phage ZorAB system protein ZorA [Psychrosphaera sp. 1_MG-2023]MDO6718707.1 anti-phage ZorAB system protein ZorA [Psychrosphaera sp. 1_MG-2023]